MKIKLKKNKWVSGLPDKVNLIVTGQEYVAIGESVSN